MGNLVTCRDVVIGAIDLKKRMELKPWESCIGGLATTPGQVTATPRTGQLGQIWQQMPSQSSVPLVGIHCCDAARPELGCCPLAARQRTYPAAERPAYRIRYRPGIDPAALVPSPHVAQRGVAGLAGLAGLLGGWVPGDPFGPQRRAADLPGLIAQRRSGALDHARQLVRG